MKFAAAATVAAQAPAEFRIIRPGLSAKHYWADLWEYRELLYILAWRDIAVRYKQTVVGVVWALARPLLTVAVFTVVFGKLARLPVEAGVPYPMLVFAGMLPWTLFSTCLTDVSESVIGNERLISKVYFPRLIIPAASMAAALVDFAINAAMIVPLMIWFGYRPSPNIVLLPFFIACALMVSLGPALIFTALNVKYRDFRYVIPFVVQFGLYVSPVGFGSSIVPPGWRLFYSFNPMVGIIDGFRWCILGRNYPIDPVSLAISLSTAVVLLSLGLRTFRKIERSFADVI